MPRSFLISRRRKLRSNFQEPFEKSPKSLRLCHSGDDKEWSPEISCISSYENHCNEDDQIFQRKEIKMLFRLSESQANDDRFIKDDRLKCFEELLKDSSRSNGESRETNVSSFQRLPSSIFMDNINISGRSITTSLNKDSTKAIVSGPDRTNNNSSPESYSRSIFTEHLQETEESCKAFAKNTSKSFLASNLSAVVSPIQSTSIHTMPGISTNGSLNPLAQFQNKKTDLSGKYAFNEKADKVLIFETSSMAPSVTIPMTFTDKHGTSLSTNSKENSGAYTSSSESTNTSQMLSIKKNYDKQTFNRKMFSVNSPQELNLAISEISKKSVKPTNTLAINSSINYVSGQCSGCLTSFGLTSSPLSLSSRPDSAESDKWQLSEQTDFLKEVCPGVDNKTPEGTGESENKDMVSLYENNKGLRHKEREKSPEYSISSSCSDSIRCPQVLLSSTPSPLFPSQKIDIVCKCATSSQPLLILQPNQQYPQDHSHPSSVTVWQSLLHQSKLSSSSLSMHFQKKDTKISKPEANLNDALSSSIYQPDPREVSFTTSQLSEQLTLHKCQEVENTQSYSPFLSKELFSSHQAPSDANNNQEGLKIDSSQNFLSTSEVRRTPVKMNRRKKRRLKSFMISSIINDLSNGEEEKSDLPENHCCRAVQRSALSDCEDGNVCSDNENLLKQKYVSTSLTEMSVIEKSDTNATNTSMTEKIDAKSKRISMIENCQSNTHASEFSPLQQILSPMSPSQTFRADQSHCKHAENTLMSKDQFAKQQFSSLVSILNTNKFSSSVGHHLDEKKLSPLNFDKQSPVIIPTTNNAHSNKDAFHEAKSVDKSEIAQYAGHPKCPIISEQSDILSDKFLHTKLGNVSSWPLTVKGIYNPMPVRFHPRTSIFSLFSPALFMKPTLSPPTEPFNPDLLPFSSSICQNKDYLENLTDAERQFVECDIASTTSSESALTASSSIPSPSLSHCNYLSPERFTSPKAATSVSQDKSNHQFRHDAAYVQDEINEKHDSEDSKNFKLLLEQRNVKLEYINGGNGIKNPLLSTEIVDTKLDLPLNKSPLSCPVCNSTFDLAKHLQKHLKTHREIKRFLCCFCGKGFNDTFDLKRHTRTHTGIRPYKCSQCDKAFTQRCSLESHCKKIHGLAEQMAFNERRVKLYVCEVCGHSTDLADEYYSHNRHAHPSSQTRRRISM